MLYEIAIQMMIIYIISGTFGDKTHPDPYTCFVDSDKVNGYTGKVYAGIRQMNDSEHDLFVNRHSIPVFKPSSSVFTTNYTARVFSASCKYFDVDIGDWSFKGCAVSFVLKDDAHPAHTLIK